MIPRIFLKCFRNSQKGLVRHTPRLFSEGDNSKSPISEEYLRKAFRRAEKDKQNEWTTENGALKPEIIIDEEDSQPSHNKTEIRLKKEKKVPQTIIKDEIPAWVGPKEDMVLESPYGDLKIPAFYVKKLKGKISKLFYLENDTKSNFVKKVFKEDKTSLLMFPPKTNYHNIRNLLEGFARKIGQVYFPEEEIKTAAQLACMSPEDIKKDYHLTIRKMIEMRNFLSRICVVVGRDFSVRAEDKPSIAQELKNYLLEFSLISQSDLNSEGNLKQELLLPLSLILKVNSLKNLEEKGIELDYLFENFAAPINKKIKEQFNPKIFKEHFQISPQEAFKDELMEEQVPQTSEMKPIISKYKVYPIIGTFLPTNRVLIKFVFNRMREKQNFLKLKNRVLDIGVGTGLLPILFRLAVQSTKQAYFGIDLSPTVTECAKRNCNLQNIQLKTAEVDIRKVKLVAGQSLAEDFPETFDFIVCNPPWVISKPIEDYDTGNFDRNEETLQAVFRLVPKILDRSVGSFWLIYTDLSELLGLQQKHRVYSLAKDNGLVVKNELKCEADAIEKAIKTNIDVMKKQSNYLIYEIGF